MSLAPRRDVRGAAVRRARRLNAATIGWNAVEGVVAVAAGAAAGSGSLIGFGFDSAIEVSAALVLTWPSCRGTSYCSLRASTSQSAKGRRC